MFSTTIIQTTQTSFSTLFRSIKMPLTVHHLNNSRSQRILWLLEELEVPYTIEHYQRLPTRRAPESLRKIHPLGKSPVITDGDVTIAESGAIVEYIIKTYGKGRAEPKEENWVRNTQWSHYSEGSLMPLMVNKLIFSIVPSQAPFLVRPLVSSIFSALTKTLLDPELKTHFGYIETELKKYASSSSSETDQIVWFAGGDKDGNPTSADYQMLFPMEAASAGRVPVSDVVKDWVNKVHARPAYKRALEKGGTYAYA